MTVTRNRHLAVAVLFVSVLMGAAACSQDGLAKSEPDTDVPGSTAPESDDCVEVSQALRDNFEGLNITGAVEGPAALNGAPRWYYSTPEGATWISASTPDGSDAGLTLPVNDAARTSSTLGVDVLTDAPTYNGASDADPGAGESRDCAESSTEASSGPVDGSTPGCVAAYREALTSTFHFPLLDACSTLDEYVASAQEVGSEVESDALRRLRLTCEMTDVGVRGEPESYSPLCSEAFE